MADTPIWAGPVPVQFTGAYQTKHFNAGIQGGTITVHDALHTPPQMPSIITAPDFESLPSPGGEGPIYKTLDDGKKYRWTGFSYAEVDNPRPYL